MSTLTPEQIKNWRNVLVGMIGMYAFIMPDEQVQMFRDRMQENVDAIPADQGTDCTPDDGDK